MDTKTLVVGQTVWMRSSGELIEAAVSATTEKGVWVDIWYETPVCGRLGCGVLFDKKGNQLGSYGYGPDAWDPRPICGKSGEPFELVDK